MVCRTRDAQKERKKEIEFGDEWILYIVYRFYHPLMFNVHLLQVSAVARDISQLMIEDGKRVRKRVMY